MSRSDSSLTTEIIDLEAEFYEKTHYFSYSGLQKLLYSPKLWYTHYILQEREERLDSHLIEGKVIHCLLLDDDNFNKQFIISPSKVPTGNNKIIMDKLFYIAREKAELDVSKIKDEYIINILSEINLHQSLKTDQQRLDKVLSEDNLAYYKFLAEKGTRDIVDEDTLTKCKNSVDILKSNERVMELLCLNCKSDDVSIYNEYGIMLEPGMYPFGFKGIIDNLVIDNTNKVVYINDLKTSGKTLSDFKETIEYYKYWLQAAIYMYMVKKKFNLDETWKIKFTFIVIDKYLQVYPFEVSEATMNTWMDGLLDTVKVANYHYENKIFDLPYEFCTNSVIL